MEIQSNIIHEKIYSKALSRFGQLGIIIGIVMMFLSSDLNFNVERGISISIIVVGSFIWLSEYTRMKYFYRAVIVQIIFFSMFGGGIASGVFNGAFMSWLFIIPVFSWFFLGFKHAVISVIIFILFLLFIFYISEVSSFYKYNRTEQINSFFSFIAASVIIFFSNRIWKQAGKRLQDALHSKNLLLREIHHRTRNNLALADNIMQLEALKTDNDEAARMSNEMSVKLNTIITVNEKLYKHDNIESLNLIEFISDIVPLTKRLYNNNPLEIIFSKPDSAVTISPDDAVKLGIVINELMTNSFKHAFADIENPEINISLSMMDQRVLLTYADNGPGISADSSENFGLSVIKNLVKDIPGGYNERKPERYKY